MIRTEENPQLLNKFLDYCLVYQKKSPNSVEQYNSDLNLFLKYMRYHFHDDNSKELSEIKIKGIDANYLSQIKQDDIHAFISYMSITRKCGPATCDKKISTIRIFFKYLTITTQVLANNPAHNLETPKLAKRLPK